MKKKLKPCPICGARAELNVSPVDENFTQVFCPDCGASNVWGYDAVQRWNKRNKIIIQACPICGTRAECHHTYDDAWVVQCPKCYLTIRAEKNHEEAIAAWNRRPND